MKLKHAVGGHRIVVAGVLAAAMLGTAAPAAAVEHGVYIAGDYGTFNFNRSVGSFDVQLEPFLSHPFAPTTCAPMHRT